MKIRKIQSVAILVVLISVVSTFLCWKNKGLPAGMVYLPAGIWEIASYDGESRSKVKIKPFFIDKNLVTVADFEAFVKATGYQTQAEKFGNSAVFNYERQEWEMVDGADYHFPFGPGKDKSLPDHPVTQISWNDAKAYADWKGKRLPTAAEWEWAASSAGKTEGDYSWGDKLIENGKYKANTWQGEFPVKNTKEDGFNATSPVGHFGANPIGLTDMGGNVWQWTADIVKPTAEEALSDTTSRIVTKGGSFLCDPNVCHGFKIKGKSSTTPETGLSHTGFRCVQSKN